MTKFRNRPVPQPLNKETPMSDTPAQDPVQPPADAVDQPVTEVAQVDTPSIPDAAQAPADGAPVTEKPTEPTPAIKPTAPAAPVKPTPQPAPLVKPQVAEAKPAPTQTDDADQDPSLSEEEAYLAKIATTGTPAQKRILEAVKIFVERTQPRKPMKRGEGMQAQSEFLDHLFWLLDSDPSEFQKGWATLLVFFKAYHGDTNSPRTYSALSEYRSCDFREDWQDVERMQAYTNLITLLRATRHKPTRSHDVKRVKLDMISPQFVTDHRLENLQRFYNV